MRPRVAQSLRWWPSGKEWQRQQQCRAARWMLPPWRSTLLGWAVVQSLGWMWPLVRVLFFYLSNPALNTQKTTHLSTPPLSSLSAAVCMHMPLPCPLTTTHVHTAGRCSSCLSVSRCRPTNHPLCLPVAPMNARPMRYHSWAAGRRCPSAWAAAGVCEQGSCKRPPGACTACSPCSGA